MVDHKKHFLKKLNALIKKDFDFINIAGTLNDHTVKETILQLLILIILNAFIRCINKKPTCKYAMIIKNYAQK